MNNDVRGTIRGIIDLMRIGNAVAAGVLTFTGAFVAGGLAVTAIHLIGAIAATIFATAAGNAINDYFDRAIDRINRPMRPIPRGAISERGAIIFSGLLFVAAIVSTLVLPVIAIALAVANLLALVAYTELFKGLPGVGNIVVAYLTGSTFLFGAAAVGQVTDSGVIVLFILAALATATREIIKDIEDIDGDRQEGLQTLPIVIGVTPARRIATGVLVIAITASVVPYIIRSFGIWYLTLVVPADMIMLAGVWQAPHKPAQGQQLLKIGMFVAAAAFVLGRAVTVAGI
ncbi:geranylgeranylglycerol-phosphate geranylgeranyltransferase [Haloquadratum walsbyi]|uniref:Digeranylgeranylglyceryl phosphate synthase n=1 Tax=Haloquadratum walsbyi J07HQW2 TaxID=1238425 RepID=U1NIE6_9EURY|nr:geranylgeranylglycerol-phosphate geranylgeranyltransferase [Haloquadratum walsbyi]ERG96960.1 MAG: UbiA prenyltransferase [Haloquadratum walsbyi J07HQW2]